MVFIQDVLISEDVFQKKFACALNACQGACCWEGDFGAPLEDEEIQWLEDNLESLRPFLDPEGLGIIQSSGVGIFYPEMEKTGTPLRPDGSCAYMVFGPGGKAHCGIQMAFEARGEGLQKPISCHLFPLRILEEPHCNFTAINYEVWEICSSACRKGESSQIPVFRFVKDAIIRRFGPGFYSELEHFYSQIKEDAVSDEHV